MASNPLSHVLLQKRLQRSKQPLALGCGACLVVLSATSFIPQLEPLRLLGLYGSLHSALLYALASSQDIPDPKLAKERLKRGELAKLGLSALGCALLSEAVSGQQGPLPKLAQRFLLPLTASLGALSGTVRSPLCVYLVLHFAMACVRPSENFADEGWQSCALTLLFNCVILGAVHLHTSELLELQKVVDETVSMLEQMASVMCDGFCCLQSNGDIVMINRGLAGLLSDDVEGAMVEWIGLPFETLQFKAFQSEDESGRVEPGPRRLKLRKKGGGALDVETLTLRLSLPQEALTLILGDGLDNFSESEPIFLRTMRTRQSAMDGAAESLHLGSVLDAAPSVRRPGSLSDLGAARALSELGADHDSSFGLRSNCGSYVSSVPPTPTSLGISRRNSNNSGFSAFSRRSSEGLPMRTASSETQSVISSAASDTPANFTNRRLELMRDKLMSLNQDSTSMIMELDVPVWQSEVSSLCGPSSQARVRLRSKQAGGRREFDGESMVSGSFVSEACTEEGEDGEDEAEEVVRTEVIGAQPSA